MLKGDYGMKANFWKIRAGAAASVCLCLFLAGCQTQPQSETYTAAETEFAAPPIVLLGEGAPVYTIIRAEEASDTIADTAIQLRRILDQYGMKPKILTDFEKNPVSEYEIVLGDTARTCEALEDADLGAQGYYIVAEGQRIFLGGATEEGVQMAMEQFLSEFFGYDEKKKVEIPASLSVPGDYREIVHAASELRSLTVEKTDIASFVIAANKEFPKSISCVQNLLAAKPGVKLKTADTVTGPSVRFEKSSAAKASVSVENGDIVIRAADDETARRAFTLFFNENIRGESGDGVTLPAGVYVEEDVTAFILYSEFGAKGDGKTDDMNAIRAAHAYANQAGVTVRADTGAVYRIGAFSTGAEIRTDTDWRGARFIVDDTSLAKNQTTLSLFTVKPDKASYTVTPPASLPAQAENIGLTLPQDSIVELTDKTTPMFNRYGANGKYADEIGTHSEMMVVSADGTVDPLTANIWEYLQITSATVYPIDPEILTIRGGVFTTIATQTRKDTNSAYYRRGILVNRSNVVIDGLEHYVEDEKAGCSSYMGFLRIARCTNVTAKNCVFTGRLNGGYDISPSYACHITFENCIQSNDILDTNYWGIMACNGCIKTITLKNCSLSRVDAHTGFTNVTIENCTLGHQGVNLVGYGYCVIENTTLYGKNIIKLRPDYGSTWQGDVTIRNCTWVPQWGEKLGSEVHAVFHGDYEAFHNFGYPCYMPIHVTIENLTVRDGNYSGEYGGVYLFNDVCTEWTDDAFVQKMMTEGYPYHLPESVTVSGITTESGLPMKISPNTFMFRDVPITGLSR